MAVGVVRRGKINARLRLKKLHVRAPNIERGGSGGDRMCIRTALAMGVYLSRTGIGVGRHLVRSSGSSRAASGSTIVLRAPTSQPVMGKHLAATELDTMHAWKVEGLSATEIHRRLERGRTSDGRPAPKLTTVRRALRGITHKRGRAETRGRKRILSPANVRALNSALRCVCVWGVGPWETRLGRDRMIGSALRGRRT